MNKLMIKTKSVEFNYQTDIPLSEETLLTLLNQMMKTNTVHEDAGLNPLPTIEEKKKPGDPFIFRSQPGIEAPIALLAHEKLEQREGMPLKDRLPNREQIDLQELEVKIERMTAHNLFRCPKCHQASRIIIDHQAYIRPIECDDTLYDTEIPSNSPFTYLEGLIHTRNDGLKIVASQEILGVCPDCGESHSLIEWIRAYDIPTDGRTKDEICPVCGDDIILIQGAESQRYACDDPACNSHQLDQKIWEGRC